MNDEFTKLVNKMGIDKAKEMIEKLEKEKFPKLGWCPQPLVVKKILKTLEKEGEMKIPEMKVVLQEEGLIGEDSNDGNIGGLIRWNVGLWGSDDNQIYLTDLGKEIAKKFDNNLSTLNLFEKILILGMLHDQGIHAFLFIMMDADNWEISRKELEKRMAKMIPMSGKRDSKGTVGTWFVGQYSTTLYRLGLISKRREGRNVYYKLELQE